MNITTTPRRGTLAALAAVALATPMLMGAAWAAPGDGTDDWQEVWRDDFDGAAGTGLDTDHWKYDIGHGYPGGAWNWGTGEIAYMTDSTDNVAVDGNGFLEITPVRDGSGAWTSGRVETLRDDFEPPDGGVLRVESRIKLPDVSGAQAQGIWPAFWMLGEPYRDNVWSWPSVGEIDILENINGIDTVYSTLHCGYSPGGPCNETIGLGGSTECAADSCQKNFHEYRFEWDRSGEIEQMRWYLDGRLFHTVNETAVDATTWANATNHGFFIILNVAVGGEWPGLPTAQTASGVPMVIDYVAVSRRGGGATDPDPTTDPTPTPDPTTTPTPDPTTDPTPDPTPDPDPTGATHDAFGRIEVEDADASQGVTILEAADEGGGQGITGVSDGDWVRFDSVDFGTSAPHGFSARVASGAEAGRGGLVEVRLDSPDAAPVGTFAVSNTGGWQAWRTVPGNIAAVTGVHTVYLTFTSAQPHDYLNVNWLTFWR